MATCADLVALRALVRGDENTPRARPKSKAKAAQVSAELAIGPLGHGPVPVSPARPVKSARSAPAPTPEAPVALGSKLAAAASKARQVVPEPRTNHAAELRARTWLIEFRKACEHEAASGATGCIWASKPLWGCCSETAGIMTARLAQGLDSFGFIEPVAWWRGTAVGWSIEPGGYPDEDARPKLDKRQFGAWGFQVRLRVSWGTGDEMRQTPWRDEHNWHMGDETPRQAEFDDSCRICHDTSHRRASLQPCQHVLCRACALRTRGRPCPACGTTCAGLVNHVMLKTIG